MDRRALFAAATLLVAMCAGSYTAAQEVRLIFTTVSPSGSPLNTRTLVPWAEAVNKDGKGVIRLEPRFGYTLVNFENVYERVMDDVVQVSIGLQTYIAGQFPLSDVVSLANRPITADQNSVAFWRLYKTGLLDVEYKDVKLLGLYSFVGGGIHTRKPITDLRNLAGLKLFTYTKLQADIVSRLGGTPISIPLTALYEAIQRDTVDGAAIAWTAFPSFKLSEVTKFHVAAQVMSGAPGMLFMARKKYDSLSAQARAVLDRHSGIETSRMIGEYWKNIDEEVAKAMSAAPGHKVVTLNGSQLAEWEKSIDTVASGWATSVNGGRPVLEQYRQIVTDVMSGR
jgi:TRAP-type transport system periplasmic protein